MATATGVYHTSYEADYALRKTRAERIRLVLIAGIVVAAPFVLDAFWLTVANQVGIAIIGAVGLNILVGHTGLISLGHGAFLGVGAYTSALMVARLDAPVLVAVATAVAVTTVVGTFFGLPSLRLKGLYLAMATLAAQFILLFAFRNWDFLTGGVDAIVVPYPEIFGWTLGTDFAWYWVIFGVATVVVLAVRNLFRTGLGRAFHAVRDQDVAAAVMGIDVGRQKLLAFAISSGLVGLAGALTAHYRTIITWERFTLDVSVLFLAMIIVGGLGSVAGSVYGATFMTVLPALIQQFARNVRDTLPMISREIPAIQLIVFGLVIVLFLLFEPRGLDRLWQRVKDYFRLWPFRY
ncbi:MAG TPA: branched-chain amino acid ABC transporter permease [Jiangellaceae bacterium]